MDIREIKYGKGRELNSLRGKIKCELAYVWHEVLFFPPFSSSVLIKLVDVVLCVGQIVKRIEGVR